MATAQLPTLAHGIDGRERSVQSEYREDLNFRLHVARVEESEPSPKDLPKTLRVPLSPLRTNGKTSQGVGHEKSETFVSTMFDNGHIENGLSQLPLAGHSLADLERETIQQTLKVNDGSRKQSAKILGISVRTLQRKLKEYSNDGN
ncbi:helix-turn-helix domain-containing protein [Bythopirellula goksoeyrii]|nr:helix-turn-helix domain-containing protein [Bythopirellula goksoeyrii]